MSQYEYDFSEGIKQYKAIIDGGEADFVHVTAQKIGRATCRERA